MTPLDDPTPPTPDTPSWTADDLPDTSGCLPFLGFLLFLGLFIALFIKIGA